MQEKSFKAMSKAKALLSLYTCTTGHSSHLLETFLSKKYASFGHFHREKKFINNIFLGEKKLQTFLGNSNLYNKFMYLSCDESFVNIFFSKKQTAILSKQR